MPTFDLASHRLYFRISVIKPGLSNSNTFNRRYRKLIFTPLGSGMASPVMLANRSLEIEDYNALYLVNNENVFANSFPGIGNNIEALLIWISQEEILY